MAETTLNADGTVASRKKGGWEGHADGYDPRPYEVGTSQIEHLFHNSVFHPANTAGVWGPNSNYTLAGRAGKLIGAIGKDVLTDGSRVPYWALNHPLAGISYLGEAAAAAANLAPDYDLLTKQAQNAGVPTNRTNLNEMWSKQQGYAHSGNPGGLPQVLAHKALPALAALAMVQTSGNHDMLNVLGGGRAPGFQAVLPKDGSLTESANAPAEAVARYIFGRTGRVLPWEEFTAERPEVSPDDYKSYRAHQFDRGPLGIGLIKGTTRNLDQEPEFTLMGFRTPLSSVGTAAGAMAGGVAGSHAAAKLLSDNPKILPQLEGKPGPQRLAGAVVGALLGAVGGNLGTKAANAAIIQPILNPERAAAQQAWEQQQRALGLI